MKQFVFFIIIMILGIGCRKPASHSRWSADDSMNIIQQVVAHRSQVDSFFRFDPQSPFKRDTTIRYEGIHWFAPDVNYCFESKLYRYESPETVIVLGTKGEERKHLGYGYFKLTFGEREFRLNAYKFTPSDARRYELYRDHLNVWFTDSTTGEQTYEVGRYVDVGTEEADPDHKYRIDFNRAYNPYCAYSELYSCAIPRKEDHLNFSIGAGEKKYHE